MITDYKKLALIKKQTAFTRVLKRCLPEQRVAWLCLHTTAELERIARQHMRDDILGALHEKWEKAEDKAKSDAEKQDKKVKSKKAVKEETPEEKAKKAEKKAQKAEKEAKAKAQKAEEDAFLAGQFVIVEENAPEMSESPAEPATSETAEEEPVTVEMDGEDIPF